VRNQRDIIWELGAAQDTGKGWAPVNTVMNLWVSHKKKLTISPLTEELLASQEELCSMRSVRKMDRGRLLGTSKRKLQNVKVDRTEIPWGNVA
jgi:hypothetical protein